MKDRSGFTIVELLVVIVVIGVLAAISLVSYSGINTQASKATMQSDLSNGSKMTKLYYVENGLYPNQLDPSLNCPFPTVGGKYCLKSTQANQLIYAHKNSRTDFVLISARTGGDLDSYYVSSNSSITKLQPVTASGGTPGSSGNFNVNTFTSSGTFTVTNGGVIYVEINGGGGGGGACYNESGADGGLSTIRIGAGPTYEAKGGGGGTDAYGDSPHNNSPGGTTEYDLFGTAGGAGNGGLGVLSNGQACQEGAGDNGGAGGRAYGYLYVDNGATISVVVGGGGSGGYYGGGHSGSAGGAGSVIFKYLKR